jgi:hypothetical protein
LKIPRSNQKSSIEEEQTIQCNRKIWRYQEVIKSRPLKKDRQTFDYPLVSPNISITLYCLYFFNGRLLITPWYLQIFLLHCIVCPSSMDDFWLPLVSSSLSITLCCLSFNRKIWRYQGVTKSRPLKKDRQHNVIERLEDTKG